jgi:hypothetical protein
MKQVIIFKGGLGNQLFQYGMYTYRKRVLHRDVAYLYREGDHNGFEIDKYFDVDLCKAPLLYDMMYWFVWRLYKYGINRRLLWLKEDKEDDSKVIYINGYWLDKKYILHPGFDLKFKPLPLSDKNRSVAHAMQQSSSIAVHVRRGDYLSAGNIKLFHQLDTDYFTEAIRICKEKTCSPHRLFFFSDDIAWVKENLKYDNAVYIDWNKGNDSIYDMYLMSLASANVIANSTFSFWSAFLNKRKQAVVYPKKWFSNGDTRDIFPDEWIAL